MYTIAEDIKKYKPVLTLNKYLSRKLLTALRTTFFFITVLSGIVGIIIYYLNAGPAHIFLGISLIFFGFWLEQILIFSYSNSYYFFGLNSIIGLEDQKISGATYEVAETLLKNEEDVTKAFCTSRLGTVILIRAGVDPNMLGAFLQSSRVHITTNMIPLPEEEIFTMISLGKYILQQDSAFLNMLKEQGITEDVFVGALEWVMTSHFQEKRLQRWWSKDNLAKTQGIGREWAYGTAYILQKYSRNINTSAVFSTLTQNNSSFAEEKIMEIEVALARAKASNVIIIGEAGVGKIDLLIEVERRMKAGKSINSVENQNMILLDTNRLFATHRNKQALEMTILSLFTEAANAGNIIIVIENLSTFIREAEAMGIFIPELLDPYLATANVHVVATDTPGAYHTFIEPLSGFSRRFAEVLIDEPNLSSVTRTLQDVALQNENRYQTIFTFAALKATTEAADHYVVEGAMPDKAIELLIDIATRASQAGVGTITTDYVYTIVSEKTGIPAGPISEQEKDMLLNLEEKLHERVIGQQSALNAIARTMRRARVGIQSTNKPIGSFLFLGPSGVGKTETAKALAFIFFGDEKKMHRIDMSEFSGEDSLKRLIGDGNESGILTDMLREHPYAVLLLDEFEKGSRLVHDIFLQVLDEGFFTDSRGNKVNARNTIIIATSNAGSQLILRTIEQRRDFASLDKEIVNHIIKEGIYRPELINRFDNTVIFEPLKLEEQGQVASLMLKDLYDRVKDRGYELEVTRDLMDILVEKGYDPQFGARPMQRVLQDIIEEKVAQKMISGEAKKGEKIILTKVDFPEVELGLEGDRKSGASSLLTPHFLYLPTKNSQHSISVVKCIYMKFVLIVVFIVLLLAGGSAYYVLNRDNVGPYTKEEVLEENNNETEITFPEVTETEEEMVETPTTVSRGPQSIIGKSAGGNDIIAHHFGSGNEEIIFIGGIHGGYSWNTSLVSFEMIDWLKSNPNVVPNNLTVTVIPVLNPDGLKKVTGTTEKFSIASVNTSDTVRVSGRFNNNNVDLNRNFDCEWKSKGTWQNREVSGGTSAFSEPESQAIRSYINNKTPKAVITWYSAAGGVYASNCKNGILPETLRLTNLFANASGYPAYEEFDYYEITGDMVNWFASRNIPAISVLLTSHNQTEWNKNKAGIEAVIKHYTR